MFNPKENANIFKDFYNNLAGDLVGKLPNQKGKFGKRYVKRYYKQFGITAGTFNFSSVKEEHMLEELLKIKTNKAAGIDGLSGVFVKDGAPVLSKPITQLINLSI